MTTLFPARPTTYKGVEMRSRMEAGFAAWLDSHKVPWAYEPNAFASEHGQYLPDFLIEIPVEEVQDDTGFTLVRFTRLYAEVKPPLPPEEFTAVLKRMAIIWDSEPAVPLTVQSPHDAFYWRVLLLITNDGFHGHWWRCRRCPALRLIVADDDALEPSEDTWQPGCDECDSPRPMEWASPWTERYWEGGSR